MFSTSLMRMVSHDYIASRPLSFHNVPQVPTLLLIWMLGAVSVVLSVQYKYTNAEGNKPIVNLFHTGNGEIDFEEFLTLMTSTEKYLEGLRGKFGGMAAQTMRHKVCILYNYRLICACFPTTGGPKDEQKENVLFSALTKFMKKSALSSLSEIERYCVLYHQRVAKHTTHEHILHNKQCMLRVSDDMLSKCILSLV